MVTGHFRRREGGRDSREPNYAFRTPLGEYRRFLRGTAVESAGARGQGESRTETIRVTVGESADPEGVAILDAEMRKSPLFHPDNGSSSERAYLFMGNGTDYRTAIYDLMDAHYRGTSKDTNPDGI